MRNFVLAGVVWLLAGVPALADRAAYLDLARRGWNYELRTTMIGRDLSIPVHINGRDFAGASLCLVGEPPHALSLRTIDAFRDLMAHVYGKPVPMRFAGADARACGSGRVVVLRLYSGYPPNKGLSVDLEWMNEVYELGLPPGRFFAAGSPAVAQTFFGRRGQGTHIMVKQPGAAEIEPLEAAFYRSILVEELFQSFTFGMDILLFDRAAAFQSKLQEIPFNLANLDWDSRTFMQALLRTNPEGLCAFDIFMLHAVATSPVDQTIEPAFIDFIDRDYARLERQAAATMADARFAPILAPDCRQAPDGG